MLKFGSGSKSSAANEKKNAAPAPASDARVTGSNHILVVDDMDMNLVFAEHLLGKVNPDGEITCVTSAAEALPMLESSPNTYSLVFLDVEMPDMDGIEAAKAIRKFNRDISIVALTAHDDVGTLQNCLDAGMDAVASKPFREASIASMVSTYNDKPSSYSSRMMQKEKSGTRRKGQKLAWTRGFFVSENSTAVEKYLKLIEDTVFKPKASHRTTFLKTLGIYFDPDLLRPVASFESSGLQDVAAGGSFSVFITGEGKVVVQGPASLNKKLYPNGEYGTPTALPAPVTHVKAGLKHIVAWNASTKYIFSWGANVFTNPDGSEDTTGQPGQSSGKREGGPGQIPVEGNVISVGCGAAHTLVLTDVGLFGFGSNRSGQLGQSSEIVPVPKSVFVGNNTVSSVACGAHHSLLVTKTSNVFCWGSNNWGQCGQPASSANLTKPTLIEGLQEISQVAGGGGHSLALSNKGKIFSWGCGSSGELGRRALSGSSHDPGAVEGSLVKLVIGNVACGHASSSAVDSQGGVWVWGCLQGEGYTTHAKAPRQVKFKEETGAKKGKRRIVKKVSCGQTHSVALVKENNEGQVPPGRLTRSSNGLIGSESMESFELSSDLSSEGSSPPKSKKNSVGGASTSAGNLTTGGSSTASGSTATTTTSPTHSPPSSLSQASGKDMTRKPSANSLTSLATSHEQLERPAKKNSVGKHEGRTVRGGVLRKGSGHITGDGGGLDELRATSLVPPTELDQTLIKVDESDTDLCVEFASVDSLSNAMVMGSYGSYAATFLGQNHFLFVQQSSISPKVVAVLRLANPRTKMYSALVFNRYGIFAVEIDQIRVLGNDCLDLASPRDLDIKLLTYFINHGTFHFDGELAGLPAEYCLDAQEDNVVWNMVSATKSRLPNELLSLECRLGLSKRVTVGVICNLDSESEEDALKNPKNNGEDGEFKKFCKILGSEVPRANWPHFDGGLADVEGITSLFYASWRGIEFIFHIAPQMSAAHQRQYMGNDKCLIVFKKAGKPVPPGFRGNVNSLAVVVESFSEEQAAKYCAGIGVPVLKRKSWRCGIFFRSKLWSFRPTGLSRSLYSSKNKLRDFVLANVVNGNAAAVSCFKGFRILFSKELAGIVENYTTDDL